MDEKLLQQVIEVNYLTAENTWRYRAILRFFYIQHEKLRHYLFPEEVYDYLKQFSHFEGYTEEQLQQDLSQLVEWKNLIPRQSMEKVYTTEDFKKKKFRYQCTPYTIEIERMIISLEEKGDSYGGSLERTLFDRLLASLMEITSKEKTDNYSLEELYSKWDELHDNFRKLTENATDYLAHLESEKVEEVMMSDEFLVYKESLTNYLRNFMTTLQRTAFKIESILENIEEDYIKKISEDLAEYYLSIPRLEEKTDKATLVNKYLNHWQGINSWFLGHENQESDLVYLQKTTNETIRRITRFAQRLGEKHHNLKSRRKDYLHLANWFNKCESLEKAHLLSACVFGVSNTRHLYADTKDTEDIYAEIWEKEPIVMTVNPRIRRYKEKTRTGAILSKEKEKREKLEEYLKEKEAEQKLIEEIVYDNKIVLEKIKLTDPYVRKTILGWIGKCMGSKDRTAKTENGNTIRLREKDKRKINLAWDDGNLEMPNYIIEIIK